ncbi:hypothetical protein BDW02DRAFT_571893 [Decorospora gaudefroyi]|uniref:Uncharacterized protein n=1 Tax=Decorospora gaudefroyi TaxID=184978 RepID=A0A6A5K449_9PLEO|nr:hypothetical protein BDW02DRAFT_571893 [Decorospora gaudefroyi]
MSQQPQPPGKRPTFDLRPPSIGQARHCTNAAEIVAVRSAHPRLAVSHPSRTVPPVPLWLRARLHDGREMGRLRESSRSRCKHQTNPTQVSRYPFVSYARKMFKDSYTESYKHAATNFANKLSLRRNLHDSQNSSSTHAHQQSGVASSLQAQRHLRPYLCWVLHASKSARVLQQH